MLKFITTQLSGAVYNGVTCVFVWDHVDDTLSSRCDFNVSIVYLEYLFSIFSKFRCFVQDKTQSHIWL